jgi:hypothetical protein
MEKKSKVEREIVVGLRECKKCVQPMRCSKCIFAYNVSFKKQVSHIGLLFIDSYGGYLRVFVCAVDLMTYANEYDN